MCPQSIVIPMVFKKKRRAPLLFLKKGGVFTRTIRRSQYEQYQFDELTRRANEIDDRMFLDMVNIGWYVETAPCANGVAQGGEVIDIIRDKFGLPVCLKIADTPNTYDWITPERVIFHESCGESVEDCMEYMTWDELNEEMSDWGYDYDEELGAWRHRETGEVACY